MAAETITDTNTAGLRPAPQRPTKKQGETMIEFTRLELMEISDSISATLDRYLAAGDTERHEKQYGTLTLLHEAQAKILPAAFGFTIDDTPWGPARAQQIAELRVEMGLPEAPTAAERSGWR